MIQISVLLPWTSRRMGRFISLIGTTQSSATCSIILRDPNRDHVHGRIYRITYEGRPLLKPTKIAGEPIDGLLALLTEPENNVRTRAKIELGARNSAQVVKALQKWTKQFDPAKPENQHHLAEALWVYQWHNVVNEPLLHQMLESPESPARAAAVRVLGYWRDRVRIHWDCCRTLPTMLRLGFGSKLFE